MRITEFSIDKYGPLGNTGKIKTAGFNLFFGKNENGKTLTIDALIKLLIGKRAKDFKHADRVEGNPDGYLKIAFNESSGEKKENTLPYDGDLPKITKSFSSPLTPSDCRNIFIIRNSDLEIQGEADFYTGITERLVGLRTSDLKKIRRNLLDIGRLTPAMDFKDDEKSSRLKTRMKNAEALINKIENAKEKLLNGKYDRLEIDLYKKTRELSSVNQMITLYEDAGKRAAFEKAGGLLSGLEGKISALKDMEIFRDDDLKLWQDSEREIKRSEGEISELRGKAADIKKDLSDRDDQLKDSKQNFDILSNKKRRLDDERINLRALENSLSATGADESLRHLLKRISFILSAITFAVFFAWFFNAPPYLSYIGILLLFVTSGLWIYEIYIVHKNKKALREFEKIKISLAENGITGDNIEDILNALGKFNEDYERIRIRSSESESGLMTLQRHLKETEEKILVHRALIDDFEKKILFLKTKSGIKTLQEYGDMLKSKRDREKERDTIAGRLEDMLEVHGRSMGEILSNIKSKIHELEFNREGGKGIEFNQKAYDDLRYRAKALEEELIDIRKKISDFEAGMDRIEEEANNILIAHDERLYCKTLVDLDEVLIRLKCFTEENNKRRDAIIGAVQIADDIGKDANEKVLDLFDSSLSDLFNMITNGNYEEVMYDKGEGSIKVKRNNGNVIGAEKLSGGAYDQLYLAIRLAIGEKLLPLEKGFFIMDDPFVKSDIERIGRQMSALKKICDMGWQILYFSCKNEIRDILSDDIKSGSVNFVDIDWVKN